MSMERQLNGASNQTGQRGDDAMISRMKARYSKGVIVPMEAHDIEEGANLFVSVEVETHDADPSLAVDDECQPPAAGRDLHDPEDYFEKRAASTKHRLVGSKEKPLFTPIMR